MSFCLHHAFSKFDQKDIPESLVYQEMAVSELQLLQILGVPTIVQSKKIFHAQLVSQSHKNEAHMSLVLRKNPLRF